MCESITVEKESGIEPKQRWIDVLKVVFKFEGDYRGIIRGFPNMGAAILFSRVILMATAYVHQRDGVT